MKYFKVILFVVIVGFSGSLLSQTEKIKLSLFIKDENNNPVSGAVVLIDGAKQRRVANKKGVFKISLNKAPKTITAFSPIIGIKKVNYIKGKKNVTIIIPKGNDLVDNSVKSKSVNPQQFATIYDFLRGNVPGVNVQGTDITIRGFNTINGNTSPLFILDGAEVTQYTFGQIIPLEIKSVSVLKGSETARYGVRGANGVIIVESKDQ